MRGVKTRQCTKGEEERKQLQYEISARCNTTWQASVCRNSRFPTRRMPTSLDSCQGRLKALRRVHPHLPGVRVLARVRDQNSLIAWRRPFTQSFHLSFPLPWYPARDFAEADSIKHTQLYLATLIRCDRCFTIKHRFARPSIHTMLASLLWKKRNRRNGKVYASYGALPNCSVCYCISV